MLAVSEPAHAIEAAGLLGTLEHRAAEVLGRVDALLDVSGLHHDDINAGGGPLFIGWNAWRWDDLRRADQSLVRDARRALDAFRRLAHAAVQRGAPGRVTALEAHDSTIARIVDRTLSNDEWGPPAKTIEAIRAKAHEAIDAQLETLRDLPTAQDADLRIVIPDTNVLLDHPVLTEWRLEPPSREVVLVPQVISELDEKKRDARLKQPAQKAIRCIESCSRRGDTLSGVPLLGEHTLREIAVEPQMDLALAWLQADVPDDRMLASAMEVALEHLAADVVLLTGDRNARNKARMAGLPTAGPSLIA